jgi:SLT domain-containing protein
MGAVNRKISGYAEGGLVTRPQLAFVGEKEPEMIIPLSKMGGQNINVTFQTLLTDNITVEKATKIIDRELNRLRRSDRSLLYATNQRGS